jgi:hypothetical protein
MRVLQKLILMFINRATLRQAPIIAASKTILKSWKLSGTTDIGPASAFGGRMWSMSSSAIWIVGIFILDLHALNVKTVDTNICSFSQERMTYIAADESASGVAKVIYESKDGKTTNRFDALDWLAQLTSHIPNRGEQPVESLPSRASESNDKVE